MGSLFMKQAFSFIPTAGMKNFTRTPVCYLGPFPVFFRTAHSEGFKSSLNHAYYGTVGFGVSYDVTRWARVFLNSNLGTGFASGQSTEHTKLSYSDGFNLEIF